MKSPRLILPFLRRIVATDNKLIRSQPVAFVNHVLCRNFASNVKEEETENLLSVREKLQVSRPVIEKVKRFPFVKSMCIGVFDTDLLDFPEVVPRENLKEIEICIQRINQLYKEKVNSSLIENQRKIPEDVLQELRELGLFGRMVPTKYGGLGLTYTEFVRLNEAIGLDWSIGTALGAHEFLGINAILKLGTEEQKDKFVPPLASGKKIAAFCCYESCGGCDAMTIRTTASFDPDTNTYLLKGTKSWVTNAEIADYYIVIAKEEYQHNVEDEHTLCFLVEKGHPGLKTTIYDDTTGLCGAGIGTVSFHEVPVPAENMLGPRNDGNYVLTRLLEMNRFGLGTLTFGVLKSLLDSVTEYVIDCERYTKPLHEYELVKQRLSKIVRKIYAMESVSYYTAGIYDTTENPECSMESSIVKTFNSQSTLYCLRELMSVIGIFSLSKKHSLERFYRDAVALSGFDTPVDISILYLGLVACQHFGQRQAKLIEERRNPAFFPKTHLKALWTNYKIQKEKFSYEQDIAGNLHPRLVLLGNQLEECVQRLHCGIENLLKMCGYNILVCQMGTSYLGMLITNIYVRTAILSRSSRSYCIGLKNADEEMTMVESLCYDANKDFIQLFDHMMMGIDGNLDNKHMTIGKKIIASRGYFPEHCMKYTH